MVLSLCLEHYRVFCSIIIVIITIIIIIIITTIIIIIIIIIIKAMNVNVRQCYDRLSSCCSLNVKNPH